MYRPAIPVPARVRTHHVQHPVQGVAQERRNDRHHTRTCSSTQVREASAVPIQPQSTEHTCTRILWSKNCFRWAFGHTSVRLLASNDPSPYFRLELSAVSHGCVPQLSFVLDGSCAVHFWKLASRYWQVGVLRWVRDCLEPQRSESMVSTR